MNEEDLRVFYLKTNRGKMHPGLFDLYLRGYNGTNNAAHVHKAKTAIAVHNGSSKTPIEQAERLGVANGNAAARRAFMPKSEKELKAWYKKNKNRNASDDVLNTYAKSYAEAYDAAKGTPMEEAQRFGCTCGVASAKQGFKPKGEEELRAWCKKQWPDASDEVVNAYVEGYTRSYWAFHEKL